MMTKFEAEETAQLLRDAGYEDASTFVDYEGAYQVRVTTQSGVTKTVDRQERLTGADSGQGAASVARTA